MVVGFNHNFRYRDRVFHIQTEDGGIRSPQITTLVYCGGTILASKKTSYADITKVSNLEQVVEELMKEQHKEMLRRLRDGDFDDKIDALFGGASSGSAATSPSASAGPAAPAVSQPRPETRDAETAAPQPASPAGRPTDAGVPASARGASTHPKEPEPKESETPALDDIILSYLAGDDDK